MKKLIPALMLAVSPMAAMAVPDVTIELNVVRMFKRDGVTPLPTGSLMVLLADVDDDGFGDLTRGNLLGDSDDAIIATFGLNGGNPIPNINPGEPGGHTNDNITFDETGLVGKDMLLVYYDILFDSAMPLRNPGNGINFGTYRTDDVVNFSTFAWVVPSPGSVGQLNVLLSDNDPNSPVTAADLTTSQSTIPEPATMTMLMVAGAGVLSSRRRRSN